ncbi:MAG: hypothetical protein WD768_13670 [Phycisphaeraceae bacterium]
MFAFELNTRQAANLGVVDTKLIGVYEHTPHDLSEPGDMPVTLSNIEVDRPGTTAVDEPITGRCHIDRASMGLGPCALRLSYTLTGCASVVQFFHPPVAFVPKGEVPFEYAPISDAVSKRGGSCPKTIAAFFRLCKPPSKDHPEGQPISNTIGMLLDFK